MEHTFLWLILGMDDNEGTTHTQICWDLETVYKSKLKYDKE